MLLRTTIIKTLLVAALAVSSVACLDKKPGQAIDQDKAMTTFSDAEQVLTGIYNSLMSGALFGGYLTLAPDIQADLVYAVNGYSNTYGDIWQWNIRGNDTYVESVYSALYTVIGRCNFFLDRVEKVRASLTSDDEVTVLDAYTGEVYLARALAYSELIKCFCKAYESDEAARNELGVVIREKYGVEQTAERSSLYESMQFVLRDLEKAESLLDEDDDAYSNPYLSLAAAHALHARTALYMCDWQTAIKYATYCIDNKSFQLSNANSVAGYDSSGTAVNMFEYMWTYDIGYELIFNIGYTYNNYGTATGQVFLNYTTDFTYFYPDYVPAQWVLNLYGSGDLRYYAYFASDATVGYAHRLQWPLLVKYFGNIDLIQNYRLYHVCEPKVFRLAEQYLIRAEARCRTKDFAGASSDLTTLRRNRMASGYQLSVSENGDWLQTISDERVRELYMEGFRLNDLKRWGWGFERTPQSESIESGSSLKVEAGAPLFVWPIPRHELEAPGSKVQPNESNS